MSIHRDSPAPSAPRTTKEEMARSDRLHVTNQLRQRLDERKNATEKRFADLWQRKRDLSNEKRDHMAAINALEMFSSQKPAIVAELKTANDTLIELGHQLAAHNFSAGKNVSELYVQSVSLSARLERNSESIKRSQSEITHLAPSAAEYDQVVILIAQMDEFFAQLNAALNGVLDSHILPPAEAE